jgi:uncharacterized membrane protein
MTTIERDERSEHGVNLAFVLVLHFGLGLIWLTALAGIMGLALSETWAIVWTLSAVATWIIDAVQIVRARFDPARAWGLTFLWWLKSFIAPFALGFEALRFVAQPDAPEVPRSAQVAAPPPPPPPPPPPEPPSPRSDLTSRFDDFARRLAGLEEELRELRQLAGGEAPVAEAPVPPPAAPPRPTVPLPSPPPEARAAAKPSRPAWDERIRSGSLWDREVSFDDLFGAKALAWAGGFVTLLGIVFFFVLAVNRGWIGPVERVTLGALASLLVFGAGLWLHRAYGPVHSALAAAGAGIAGGYATLLAATALYDLVPREIALVLAAGIAAVGTVTALAWASELIAGLGLIGAMVAPAAIALQDGEWSPIGTAFAAVMFAATASVAILRRWEPLLAAALVATIWQALGLLTEADVTDWGAVAVSAAFWLLYLAAAVALQIRLERKTLGSLPSSLVLLGGLLAGVSSVALFDGTDEGWVLLAAAVVEALVAAALFPRARQRDLSAFLGAVALGLGAVAVAILLSGPALTVAWAAEAAILAWLARRANELRYQVVALAYLTAAFVHAIFWEAPLEQLYTVTDNPANGIVAVISLAIGAVIFASYARPWDSDERFGGVFALVAPLLEAFRSAQSLWRSLTGWTAALAALYAASLGILELAERIAPDDPAAFDWGHVGVTGLWGLAALFVLALGHRRSSLEVRLGGIAWLGAVLVEAVLFDLSLDGDPRGYAILVAGSALGIGALLDRLAAAEAPAFPIVAGFVLASIGLAVGGVIQLTTGDWENYSMLGIAALYSAVGVVVYRRDRDLSTVLWAPALAVAAWAASALLSGTPLAFAWAATAAVLIVLADRIGERRLEVASLAFLVLAFLHTLGIEAPIADLFEANPHPEDGVPALLFTIGAALAFGRFSRHEQRRTAFAVSALLAIYAGSLAILGLVQAIGGAGVATDFQRGHSGVSAFWGVIGLVALYVGLQREIRWLRLAGLGLFGLALAKLFLYDLAFLSSITRALSFLAVGAVLLLGGFFMQRAGPAPRAPDSRKVLRTFRD